MCPCSMCPGSQSTCRYLASPCTLHTVPLSIVTAGFLVTNKNPDKEGQLCMGWTERPPIIHVSLGTHQMCPL